MVASTLERKQYFFGGLSRRGASKKITYFLIIKSYLSERFIQVSEGSVLSSLYPVRAGVPQGSILAFMLNSVNTADIPKHPFTVLAPFADYKAILSIHSNPITAFGHLQEHLTTIGTWLKKWRIKVKPPKSIHITPLHDHITTITLRRSECPPVLLNQIPLPVADGVIYLSLYLDKRLTRNHRTRLKR